MKQIVWDFEHQKDCSKRVSIDNAKEARLTAKTLCGKAFHCAACKKYHIAKRVKAERSRS